MGPTYSLITIYEGISLANSFNFVDYFGGWYINTNGWHKKILHKFNSCKKFNRFDKNQAKPSILGNDDNSLFFLFWRQTQYI